VLKLFQFLTFDSSYSFSVVSSRTQPKDDACDQSIDSNEFVDKEKSESEHQFSVCSSVLGKMVEFDLLALDNYLEVYLFNLLIAGVNHYSDLDNCHK